MWLLGVIVVVGIIIVAAKTYFPSTMTNVTDQIQLASESTPLYKVNDYVEVNDTATTNYEGEGVIAHRTWTGTILSKKYESNEWVYTVSYTDGQTDDLVEKDISLSTWQPNNPAKFKVGDAVTIYAYATATADGLNLIPHQNWAGTITAVMPFKGTTGSDWDYSVEYHDGESDTYVLEQDIRSAN